MKILAISHDVPGVPDDAFGPHLADEAARLYELYQSGAVREPYFCHERGCAVLILDCPNIEAARQALGSLPLVREKLIAFDFFQLAAYPGFVRLFDPEWKARFDTE